MDKPGHLTPSDHSGPHRAISHKVFDVFEMVLQHEELGLQMMPDLEYPMA